VTLLVFIFGLVFADKEEDVIFKGANVKPVVAPVPEKKEGVALKVPKATVQVAQARQDTYGAPAAPAAETYGAPAAPAVDTYGPPAAPVQDTYGTPAAPPVYDAPAPAPVQGEVGTQGYYYYYYPVASGSGSSYEPTKTTYSAPAESGGGLSSTVLIGLLLAVVLIGGIAAAFTLTNNNTGRLLNGLLNGFELDTDNLAIKVHEAIELYNSIYA